MTGATKPGTATLTVGGQNYTGWTSITIERGLDRTVSTFDIAVSEHWQTAAQPWQISPGDACVLSIDGAPVISGWIDEYEPSYSATEHTVRVAGRSKTCDLADCQLNLPGSSFGGYALDAIARAVCGKFGIGVVVQTDVGKPFPQVVMQKNESAFEFLERYARQRSVFLTDDENGNLVIATVGTTAGAGALTEGQNILKASAQLSFAKRYSSYTIFSQLGGKGITETQPHILGTAFDPAVTRFRPFGKFGEAELNATEAAERAKWEALVAAGKSVRANVTVQGWYQPDNTLWQVNQLIPVNAARLKVNRNLLVGAVRYSLSEAGHICEMTLSPPEAYTPDPAPVIKHKGNGNEWKDIIPISQTPTTFSTTQV